VLYSACLLPMLSTGTCSWFSAQQEHKLEGATGMQAGRHHVRHRLSRCRCLPRGTAPLSCCLAALLMGPVWTSGGQAVSLQVTATATAGGGPADRQLLQDGAACRKHGFAREDSLPVRRLFLHICTPCSYEQGAPCKLSHAVLCLLIWCACRAVAAAALVAGQH
jgi:hypothetical protein